ncbi:AMP-binding protein [Nocardia carnea]|uniref:AMP-binding protein n=1 Tax=Nocardia carnea TaxID=37328 RepID=UPI002458CEBF|nr:AMP-binding protein [Nocardia carnea]
MRHQGTGSEYPLSAAQLRWWVAQQLYPDIANTVAMYLDLRGPLEVELMRECGRRAARELESPGVRVREVAGRPRQQVRPEAELPFAVLDLAGRPDPVAEALGRMADDHVARLDPRTDELTVAVLYRVAAQRHLLYLRSHHLVLDGAGAVALLRRTGELYRATVSGVAVEDTGGLGISGLLAAEEDYRRSARAVADREYWLAALSGLAEPVGLAGHPAAPRPRPHRVSATLAPATARHVAAARARYGASFGELLIAAFACWFARLTGNDDPVLSLPVPARTTARLRRSAGSVSNVVPLRLTGIARGTVDAAVSAVHTKVLAALRHQRYPYEDIQRDRGGVRVERGGFGPVINVLGFVEPLRLGPLTGHAQLLSLGPVEDLLVNAYQLGPSESTISIDFQGNPARYSAATLAWYHREFLGYLERFLAAEPNAQVVCLDNPERRSEENESVIRAGAPDTRRPESAAAVRLLPELLRAGMHRPDVVAVSDETRSLTYRQVDDLSRGWAQVLAECGAGPGVPVAAAVPRSIESVLALWAIATVGACFVPIDPADPPHRIAAVLAAAGIRLGLTVAAVRPDLPGNDDGSGGGADATECVRWLELDGPAGAAAQTGRACDGASGADIAPNRSGAAGSAPATRVVPELSAASRERPVPGSEQGAGSTERQREPEAPGDDPVAVAAQRARGPVHVTTASAPQPARDAETIPDRRLGERGAGPGRPDPEKAIGRDRGKGGTGLPDVYPAADLGNRAVPWAGLRADHPAYLIHTSGTTGTPKGVLIGHRGLGPLTDYLVDHYEVDTDSIVLHAHSPVFDAHLLEVLAAFAAGARLVVAAAGPVAGGGLADVIEAAGITHLLSTPAVLGTLEPAGPPSLRVVVTGGESPGAELVRNWAPRVRLYNGYGPTEATVMTMQSDPLRPDDPALIGPALPGVRAALLDTRLRPVAAGGRGELYIGGPGVALGYLHDPAATAARFVADPAGTGARLYRTGDLVRFDPGGYEYLGRADRQLTLHGRRIEPGEIESVLTAGAEVAQAVVTIAGQGPAARLVGYVVVAEGHRFDPAFTLRRLRTVLPAPLVPAALVELARIPVTTNGKLDRNRLPEPVLPHAYRAPETETQRLVAARVAGAVGRTAVGLDDDFFALGGNSLLGVGLSAELAEATGVPVTVRWLYTTPTVADLADRIAGHHDPGAAAAHREVPADSGRSPAAAPPSRGIGPTAGHDHDPAVATDEPASAAVAGDSSGAVDHRMSDAVDSASGPGTAHERGAGTFAEPVTRDGASGVGVGVAMDRAPAAVGSAAGAGADSGAGAADDEGLQILLPLRRGGARPPLFCFHSAVPLAWCYAGLSRQIGDRPVYGVQSPVLTSGEPGALTAEALAECYLREMLRVQPAGPYHLLGWSLGGQLAHAVAVGLRARGREVAVLAMLDSVVFPPDAPPPPRPRMRDLLTHLLGDEPDEAQAARAPDLTAAEAAAELAAAGPTLGAGLTAVQLDRLHRAYIAGVEISARYRPGVFDGDLLYFSATRGMTELLDAQLWRPHVTGELLEYPVDATHGQLMNPEAVAVIAPVLTGHLARCGEPAGSR